MSWARGLVAKHPGSEAGEVCLVGLSSVTCKKVSVAPCPVPAECLVQGVVGGRRPGRGMDAFGGSGGD